VVSSCSNRKQPLVVAITTAGTASSFICREQREYARQILTGALPTNESTDSYFGLIYTLDTRHDWPELVERKDGEPLQAGVAYEDDWRDEATWIKANPSLDVCKEREKLRIAVQQAQEVKGLEFSTLRLEFNVWTQSETRWLSQLHWNACGVHPVRIQELLGRECYAGLDLSTRNDLTAFVLVFPPEQRGGPYAVLPYFWIPADRINYRVRKDHVPYDVWARDGQLIATPGNEIDFQFVEAQIAAASQQYKIVEIAYDRYEATMLSQRLRAINSNEEWVVPFGQGYASMSPASKNLETCIIGGELAHGNHPILTWMANNVVIEMDAAGNIKPSKAKSTERIDGIVALIMGLDRAIRHGGKKTVDVYQRRGPIFV
jgi:phage terminase large subunit-like protein